MHLFHLLYLLLCLLSQQLGDEGFARTTGIKNGTLLKHWQTSFHKRTNAKSQPVRKTSRTQMIDEQGFVPPRKYRPRKNRHLTRILPILFTIQNNWKKGLRGNCQFILTVNVRVFLFCFLFCFVFFVTHFSFENHLAKPEK